MRADFSDPALKAVSFDVFDTLVQRACGPPNLVFALLERRAAEISGGLLSAFQQIRPRMERLTRLRRRRPRQEVRLREIYGYLIELNLLTEAQAETLMAEELAAEKRMLIRREEGCRLLEAARAAGKRILLISDMYIPQNFLEKVLGDLGLVGYDALYLSAEMREMKYYGPLWDLVLEREKLSPAELLHVGDNEISDVQRAAERGVQALLLPKALDNFKGHPPNKKLYRKGFPHDLFPDGSLFPALSQGLTAARFYADTEKLPAPESRFDGEPFHFGYEALGPAALGFGLWLARKAADDGVRNLYFLSRDGALLKKAFDAAAPLICPEAESRYLYNSRKVVAAADVRNAADIISAGLTYFQPAPLRRFLADKFSLKIEDAPPDFYFDFGKALSHFGLALETEVGMADRDRLIPLCLELAPVILANSARKRAALTAYLEGEGFFSGQGRAVVDIGFSAQIQAGLARLGGGPLGGYYYITDYRAARAAGHGLAGLSGLSVKSFFEPFTDTFSPQFAHKYLYHVYFETFFKEGRDGALDDISAGVDGRPRLHFLPPPGGINLAAVTRITEGAATFIRDFTEKFGPWLKDIQVNPHTAAMSYLDFLRNPAPADAAMLTGLIVDDSFCGADLKYFLNPDPNKPSVWTEGAAAL